MVQSIETSSFLPNDTSRCSNERCKKRLKCKRYLDCLPCETYSYSDFNKWGRIAINTKTGAKTTLGGCNFSLMFPEPITEKRAATKEEVEKITAMFKISTNFK